MCLKGLREAQQSSELYNDRGSVSEVATDFLPTLGPRFWWGHGRVRYLFNALTPKLAVLEYLDSTLITSCPGSHAEALHTNETPALEIHAHQVAV